MSSNPIKSNGENPQSAVPSHPVRVKPDVLDEETLQHQMDTSAKRLGKYLGIIGLIFAGIIAYWPKIPLKIFIKLDLPWRSFRGYYTDELSLGVEMSWVLPLVMGLLASLVIVWTLFRSRKVSRFSVPFYLSVAGLAVPLVVLIVQQLDAFQALSLGSHSWLYPVSVLGISLAMVSLALGGTGSRRDKSISAIAAFIPPVILSFPLCVTLSLSATADYLLVAYFWAGVAIILSGIKLDTLYNRLALGKLAKWSGMSIGVLLLVAALVTRSPRFYFIELRWIAPVVGGVVVSALAAWRIYATNDAGRSRPQGKSGSQTDFEGGSGSLIAPLLRPLRRGVGWLLEGTYAPYLSISGYMVSLTVFVVVYLDALGLLNLGAASWLYPASVVGTSMAMISLSLAGKGDKRDRILSILTSLIPVAVLSLPMLLRLDAHQDPGLLSQIFVASAVAFGLSGINLHEAYVEAYILREKLRLTALRTLKVFKQVLANPPCLVGIAILLFFVIIAVLAPVLVTHADPNSWNWADDHNSYHEPSREFLFGADFYGKDVYSLTVYGSRASLIVGLAASLISIVLGTTIGLTAGYFGKISDEILMRFTDFFLVIPWFPLMIVIAMLMGKSFTNVIIVIGITSWPSTARIVRAQVLSVKEKAFVERARAIGSGSGHIISKHILPNVFPLIFANTILLIANSIFSESFLDFFGLGDPTVVSWGTMLEVAYEKGAFSSYAWWSILAPGACIVILIMSFYLIGDALDEILNPKLRKR